MVAEIKPAPSSGRYQPTAWPNHPAANAPMIPRTVVPINPSGSLPGITARAKSPTTNPKKIHPNTLIVVKECNGYTYKGERLRLLATFKNEVFLCGWND